MLARLPLQAGRGTQCLQVSFPYALTMLLGSSAGGAFSALHATDAHRTSQPLIQACSLLLMCDAERIPHSMKASKR